MTVLATNWEEKKIVLKYITYYTYSIFENGRVKKKTRLWKYKNPKYIKEAILI